MTEKECYSKVDTMDNEFIDLEHWMVEICTTYGVQILDENGYARKAREILNDLKRTKWKIKRNHELIESEMNILISCIEDLRK